MLYNFLSITLHKSPWITLISKVFQNKGGVKIFIFEGLAQSSLNHSFPRKKPHSSFFLNKLSYLVIASVI